MRSRSTFFWTLPVEVFGSSPYIGGITIRSGDAVLLTGASANRDPEVCEDPRPFDIGRDPKPQLSFGHGPHYCIGAGLARVELGEVFAALPTRFPSMQPAVPLARRRR